MTDRELMQQALDALTQANQYIFTSAKLPFPPALNATSKAAEALRARLAEPEPEVRWDASAPLVVHPHSAFQATQPQQHSEQWWRHEVSNAWAEGYEKGRVFCGCGDQIMPDDGAECGNCVAARNTVKPEQEPQEVIAKWIKANTEHREWYICPKCSHQTPRFKDEWQGLTDEEILEVRENCHKGMAYPQDAIVGPRMMKLVEGRAIEAKLKEKNNG